MEWWKMARPPVKGFIDNHVMSTETVLYMWFHHSREHKGATRKLGFDKIMKHFLPRKIVSLYYKAEIN